jgi:hypothetical protein
MSVKKKTSCNQESNQYQGVDNDDDAKQMS